MDDFIIVRVRDDSPIAIGLIRQAIHTVAQTYDINAGDIVLKGDREKDYYGNLITEFYENVKDAYGAVFSRARAIQEMQ